LPTISFLPIGTRSVLVQLAGGRQRASSKKASGAAPLEELVEEAKRCSFARLFADAQTPKEGSPHSIAPEKRRSP
jgi:hypothetical protein